MRVVKQATMYFAFGKDRRPGVQANTTFHAIVLGERTSTTRFKGWRGSMEWLSLKAGDIVRFYDDRKMKGRSLLVEVESATLIDMSTFDDDAFERWSAVEGWSIAAAKRFASQCGEGVQVRYRFVKMEP
jgi:hypothetical protein